MIKTIRVTQEDINRGQCGGQNCPVALALGREFFPQVRDLMELSVVDLWVPKPTHEDDFRVKSCRLKMPRSVKRFINKFDGIVNTPQKLNVKPFNFKLITL